MNSSSAIASNRVCNGLVVSCSIIVVSRQSSVVGSHGPSSVVLVRRLATRACHRAPHFAQGIADRIALHDAVGAVYGGWVEYVRVVYLQDGLAGHNPDSGTLVAPSVKLTRIEHGHLCIGRNHVAPVLERLALALLPEYFEYWHFM